MIDRNDIIGGVGLLLVLTAIWAAWGWIPVAGLVGLALLTYSVYGAK